ncbi:hypothetical protein LZ554_007687 [Drepanopeziza brunnea f. sp. 'monogermtubi']|nr:hypothetical protein LZ554_007687 [Drepanopeziza brunnea f. sp. 'monogermtubi']
MDAAFMPSELVVKHFVTHHVVLELGPSIIRLGRPVRNAVLAALAFLVVGDLVRASVQAVLSRRRGDRKSNELD